MNIIREKIVQFQKLMQNRGIDAYIVPTADYHQSEYVGEYFKEREFLTGFTGSSGTVVITKKEACLWTDGRYFIQAAKELEDTGIRLQKMGETGVPTICEYLWECLEEGAIIGFDGRTVSLSEGQEYKKIAESKGGSVIYDQDLVEEIWDDRPSLSKKPVFVLDIKYAGESVKSKLERIRKEIKKSNATMQIITSLDDIGWMLNLRGQDVEYFPLMLSYAIVEMETVRLYVDREKLDAKIVEQLTKEGVSVYPYNDIYKDVQNIGNDEVVLLDPKQTNYALFYNIPENVQIIKNENPIILMKAIKNETEIENIRRAHIKDGIACTRFMYWLKTQIRKEPITEIYASQKLEALRAKQEGFLWPSFDPICAYKEHAAIVHYSATEETNKELKPEGLFLADTGGNYWEGSTDITRTIALGPITEEEKSDFTTVAISMLNLADAVFLDGCTGMNLDYIAREPFWRKYRNFNHGTGHGVGYLGNIHEPPQHIHWRVPLEVVHPLEENMIITDEPGVYIESSHGIRTENELLVRKTVRNEYGQFMEFEMLTVVPIDLDAIDPDQMTEVEKERLNRYHKKVFDTITPYLTDKDEKVWLKKYTRAI